MKRYKRLVITALILSVTTPAAAVTMFKCDDANAAACKTACDKLKGSWNDKKNECTVEARVATGPRDGNLTPDRPNKDQAAIKKGAVK